MNLRISERLRCPICMGSLQLHRLSKHPAEMVEMNDGSTATVVREALLLCSRCKTWYPICSYIPVLLVFPTPLHAAFAKRNESQLKDLSEYHPPAGSPERGERSIQASFTEEWNCVQDSNLSFLYSIDELKELNRKVWLTWAETRKQEIRSVLNVGCGLGRESIALQEVTGSCELFAIDINFAVLRSGSLFKNRSDIHIVIASLFHLPFERESFDLVYSQGVIMCTYSTREAFKVISSHVRPLGYIFIWVYGKDDHLAHEGLLGIVSRAHYGFELVLRPVIATLPSIVRGVVFKMLSIIVHPLIKSRTGHSESWTLKNTNHDLRDWLSPRYAWRHSYNEVLEWFQSEGFQAFSVQSPGEYRKLFRRRLWGVGVSGQKLLPVSRQADAVTA